MKKNLLFVVSILSAGALFAQGQIGNSDMEQWENVAGSDQEPVNWNSFLTASGSFNWAADNQVESSSDIRPGSSGSLSARIWSRDAGFGVTAQGNLTVGQVNMGSASASNSANHNISRTADSDFSETLTDMPDSLVAWVKYNANNSGSQARVKATLHDDYDYRDPEDATSATHVVATAELNYSPTNGWVRISIPFNYSGPASGNTHILITFASNSVPGGGDVNDEVFIDDIELIYNTSTPTDTDGDGVTDTDEATDGTDPNDLCDFVLASQTVTPSATWDQTDCDFDGVPNGQDSDPLVSVTETTLNNVNVYFNNGTSALTIQSEELLTGDFVVYNSLGQAVLTGAITNQVQLDVVSGVYFVHLTTNQGSGKYQIFKK